MSHLTPAWQRRVRFCSEKCHISYLTPAWQPRVRCEISPIASHSSQAAWSEILLRKSYISHLTPTTQPGVRFWHHSASAISHLTSHSNQAAWSEILLRKSHISHLTPARQPGVRCQISPTASHSRQPGVRFCWEGREVLWQMSRIFRNLKAIPLKSRENVFKNLKGFLQKTFKFLREMLQKSKRKSLRKLLGI